MAKTLKAVAPENPILPTLADARFKPHEFQTVKQQAQAQAQSIDELFRAIDQVKEELRQKRLELEKRVTSRKEQIRADLLLDACGGLSGPGRILFLRRADLRSDAKTNLPGG